MAARPFRSVYRQDGLSFRHDDYSPAEGVSLWENSPILAALCDPASFHHFFDDFYNYDATATVGNYVSVTDAGSAVALDDAAGGVLNIGSDGDDNDETYLATVPQAWLFAASKPLWFEARIKLTEAATDDSNFIVGLSDTVGANTLVDNAGGAPSSYDGAVWVKVDGGTVFQFESSNAGVQVNTSNAGAFVSNTWYRIGFVFDPAGGTTGTVVPWLNGVAGTSQNITLAGLQEMSVLLGVKAGGANEENLLVDYVRVLQAR